MLIVAWGSASEIWECDRSNKKQNVYQTLSSFDQRRVSEDPVRFVEETDRMRMAENSKLGREREPIEWIA